MESKLIRNWQLPAIDLIQFKLIALELVKVDSSERGHKLISVDNSETVDNWEFMGKSEESEEKCTRRRKLSFPLSSRLSNNNNKWQMSQVSWFFFHIWRWYCFNSCAMKERYDVGGHCRRRRRCRWRRKLLSISTKSTPFFVVVVVVVVVSVTWKKLRIYWLNL